MTNDAAADPAEALRRGSVLFMGLELAVGPGALVPRPETELLARTAIAMLQARGGEPLVVDMGCGSGNLACALAMALRAAQLYAADISPAAARITATNAETLGLTARLHVFVGDLFNALPLALRGRADAVVANPPYISTGKLDGERASLLENEPREAFDAGPYGLLLHQRIAAEAPEYLSPGGMLACEFGVGQERQIRLIVDRTRAYNDLTFYANTEGVLRCFTATRR